MSSLAIWDADGVLLDNDKLLSWLMPPIMKRHLDPEESYTEEEFLNLIRQLHKVHPSSIIGWAEHHGHSREWAIEAVRATNVEVGYAIQPYMAFNASAQAKLRQLRSQGCTLAVLTHGHRDYTLPLLAHVGVLEVIGEENVFDFSVLNGATKHEEETYRQVVNKLATRPFLKHFMVEDSPLNLKASRKLGFTNIYMGEKAVSPEYEPYVDQAFIGPDAALNLDATLNFLLEHA